MATEPLQCKILLLRVSIHCEGCKKKVKRVLQSVDGVYRCDIDARSKRVTVAVTGNVSADALVKRLLRSGKHAEQWPEQRQQQPTDNTRAPGETKKQATEPDKPGEARTAEKPASGDAETSSAEQSNPKASPEAENPSKTAQPAQDGTESTSADADGAAEHAAKEATAEQCTDPQRKRKQQHQQQPEEEKKPVDAMVVVTAGSAQSSHPCHLPPPLHQQQPPVHVLSYSVARPSAASYYAAAPAARAPPPQELPYTHPPCCYYPQPSPYHGGWAPQTSVGSPACDSYSDLFSDDNANSCIVM